jgi:hypothetical protein
MLGFAKREAQMRVAVSKFAGLYMCVAMALPLGGCISTDPESLRTDPRRSYSFQTKVEYQTVYEKTSEGFLRCLTGASFRMTFAIRPRIDTAAKTASILFVHHGAWTDYWALVEIAGSANITNVKVNTSTVSGSGLSDLGETVERWTNGSQECPSSRHLTNQFPLQE